MASLRALLLGVAALLLCLAVSSALAGVPGNMGQDHMGFVVPNAQQAADFLMDVFDCEFDWEVRRGPLPTAGERGWSDWLLVHPRSHMPHVIMVKCGDHHLTQYIEIFQVRAARCCTGTQREMRADTTANATIATIT